MTESALTASILRRLAREPECYAVKRHGSAWGRRGEPDVYGCYRGRAFVLEVKAPGRAGTLTVLQGRALAAWRAAGAISAVVESVEEALQALGIGV
jgi:hypothetical protein